MTRGNEMDGPRDWSPRGTFEKTIDRVIRELLDSGQSEAIAVGEMLKDTRREERENFTYSYAMAILDEFEDAVKFARKELKRIRPG